MTLANGPLPLRVVLAVFVNRDVAWAGSSRPDNGSEGSLSPTGRYG